MNINKDRPVLVLVLMKHPAQQRQTCTGSGTDETSSPLFPDGTLELLDDFFLILHYRSENYSGTVIDYFYQ